MLSHIQYITSLALISFLLAIVSLPAHAADEKLVCERSDGGGSIGLDINPDTKTIVLFNGTLHWDYPDQVTVKAFTDDQIEFTTPDKAYTCDASGQCSPVSGAHSDVSINRDTGQMEIDAYAGNQLTSSQWTCAKAEQKF